MLNKKESLIVIIKNINAQIENYEEQQKDFFWMNEKEILNVVDETTSKIKTTNYLALQLKIISLTDYLKLDAKIDEWEEDYKNRNLLKNIKYDI